MRILITGGAGFIGSHLANKMARDGHTVIVVDNLERGRKENLVKRENLYFNKRDLRDYNKSYSLFRDKDVVVHLASKVGGIGTYLSNPYEILTANAEIDANVLKASIDHGIRKYVYASSAHVYPPQVQNTYTIIKEEYASGQCDLSYGWAKWIGEKHIQYALGEYDFFSAAIARFVGIYGPGQDYGLETGSVIPVFSHRAVKHPDVPFKVWSDGSEIRTYCYIDDAIGCIEKMIAALDDDYLIGPMNVGSEDPISIAQIANKIISISGKDIDAEYDPIQKSFIQGQRCSSELAKKELGWSATTPIYDGLKQVYRDIEKRIENEKVPTVSGGTD